MTLPSNFADSTIDLLKQVAEREILWRFRNKDAMHTRTKKGLHDPVTDADIAAEKLISAAMRKLLPGCTIIGEESVSQAPGLLDTIGTADLTVLIDPVDGTLNFTLGLPIFGTIIAVLQGDETIFGCIHDPISGNTLISEKGGGVEMRRTDNQGMAQLATNKAELDGGSIGFINPMGFPRPQRDQLHDIIGTLGHTRNLHCSAHEYRLVTDGSASFFVAPGAKPWDHAAGALAISEAGGGAVSFLDGIPYTALRHHGTVVVAGSPEICTDLRQRLSFLDAGR